MDAINPDEIDCFGRGWSVDRDLTEGVLRQLLEVADPGVNAVSINAGSRATSTEAIGRQLRRQAAGQCPPRQSEGPLRRQPHSQDLRLEGRGSAFLQVWIKTNLLRT
ncbi:hypothetical protein THAOC_17215 [Thalassiosira oceanica]|uniref:Uncharacterized protein n=1 Tax=Thalassiosira oceanica TaxID=159749 RepID=K0SBA3_THAOC|nr:hypothetical protein THAOC_17215 [Thalassiosira oceanica]|eukprot:EJK62184.1 hypothetical protein THAOC_17215 [Thalassiosira oceanica]